MYEFIEAIIILVIIVLQFYLAYRLWIKIVQYRSIYNFEDLPIISEKYVSKSVFEDGKVEDILAYDNDNESEIGITYLDYNNKCKVLKTIVKYINVYLIKNKGASIDFHLIKDIVDKHTETIQNQIENRIPAPLYLGLAATMIGIIVGLFSVNFDGGNDALDAIQPLINGVKWAMSASVIGLIITTFFSIKVYKDALTEADEEKSEFLSKLQSELMPRMATGNLPEVSILSNKLDSFARATNNSVSQLGDIVEMSHKTVAHEQRLIEDIANLNIKKVTDANIRIFQSLDGMMDSFQNFAKYYNKLDQSMVSTTELLSNLKQFVSNTQNVNVILEQIKNSIIQSNQAASFFNEHIQSFKRYDDAIMQAVAKNDSAFQEAVSQLTEATIGQFNTFNELISTFDSKLSEAFTKSVENFTKTMDEQVRRTEEAFENGRPQFEKLNNLDKLDKLEAIESKLVSLEGQLTRVITNGNRELISVLQNLNISVKGHPSSPTKTKISFINGFLTTLKFITYTLIIFYGVYFALKYFHIIN